MFEAIQNTFDLKDVDLANYSPLTLAYIGDCVYELIIRTCLVYKGNAPVDKLNREASSYAKATTQAKMVDAIMDNLTNEEQSVYRRGRNAHSGTKAKNATLGEYRKATGFEAVIGYLYIKKDFTRITEIVRMSFEHVKGSL